MSGTLYLVPTPIGCLDDLSPRARQVLGSVSVVAAEDTRVTRKLFDELGLAAPRLISNHDHNERSRADELVHLMREGHDVAVVSDAGTPLVSDPGFRAVVAAHAEGLKVVPLPGPSAVITALSASGLATDAWWFGGFLPRQGGKRRQVLEGRKHESATLVWFEAPHRIVDTLRDIDAVLGPRQVCVARSLTKVWEELLRGTAAEVADRFAEEGKVLGELTLVVEGFAGDPSEASRALADDLVQRLVASGVSPGVVRDVVSGALGLPRRAIYQQALRLRDADEEAG
jgi:16S rRNA (cytidine1402-2'-O)-methyltransferase